MQEAKFPDFRWSDELKLTGSFLLNRLIPILVYFVAFFLVLQLATPHEIDSYSFYTSLFNTVLAFGLSMLSGVRFYAVQFSHQYVFKPIMVLAMMMGAIVASGFFIYGVYFVPSHLYHKTLSFLFALIIPISFCYEYLVVYGESKRHVKGSNQSNQLSLPIFLLLCAMIFLLFVPNVLSSMQAVAWAYFFSESLVLLILVVYFYRQHTDFIQDDNHHNAHHHSPTKNPYQIIQAIIGFSLPIIVLQFLKRVSQTKALLVVADIDQAVSMLQTLFMVALLFSVFAAAFANNGFVVLANIKNMPKANRYQAILPYFYYNGYLMLAVWLVVLVLVALIWADGVDTHQMFLLFVKDNPISIMAFVAFEMILWSVMIYGRALGDSWRIQTVWLLSLVCLASGVFLGDFLSVVNVVWVFLLASVISSGFGVVWIRQQLAK